MKLPIEDVYTRLKIVSRRKTNFQLGRDEVDMYDIFVAPDDETVLVEGSPGIGKTTFCLKIAYDWANGKIPQEHSFPEFEIVLLLKCRDIDGNVLDAINEQLLPEDEKLRKALIGYIKEFHYHGKVLLILDGLDELPEKFKPNVDKLLRKKILPFCYVLATSRQERGIQIRQKVDFDVLLQIEGFTDADAFEYIRKHFNHLGPEHLSKGERLIKAIQENPFLHALPSNPLNLLLLCVVFEDYEGELPSRRTELYQIIVRCILRRFCAKNNLEAPKDDEALEKKFEQSLLALGELAWKCLLEGRLSFREGELAKFEEMYPDLAARISGLVFKEASLKKINPQHEYHFFHKTFAEYLAATYLAFLLLKKDVNIFKGFKLRFRNHIAVKHRQVFLFLSGILGEEASILFRQIGEKLKSGNWDWLKCKSEEGTFLTESFSESGNAEEVVMALFSFIPFPLTVEVGRSSSFFEVAKYCRNFSHLRHPVHLSVCCDKGGGDLTLKDVNSAFDYLKSCPKLQSLFVSTLETLGDTFYDGLSQNSTLMSFTLRTFQSLPSDIADIVGNSLAASNTLTSVTFELFNEWGEAWARALEKGLSADTPLKSVVLNIYGSLSDTAILALKRVLVNTSLTSVVITIFGDMQDSLAAALCEGLSEQAALKSFTLIVFGRLSESGIVFLKRGFLQNYSLDALEVKIFGEVPDRWANVVKGIISANKAKQSCTFHPNTSRNIAAAKVACLTPVLAKRSFNLEQTLNVWGELSCEVIEAVGRLLVKSTPCRLTLNIHGNVTDVVASSLPCYLKIEKCVHLVTFNIWGELTTNGRAAIERFSGANRNANLKVIVHDLISECSPCGLHFCIDNPSLLPSVFAKVKDTGTSELSLTIRGVSNDWEQGLNDGLTNSTSLTTLALTIESFPGKNVGWMQRLLEVVLENTSLATLNLTLTLYSLTDKGIDLSNSFAKNASLTALPLTINSHIRDSYFLWSVLCHGLALNKSLHTLTLTINNYSDTAGVRINGLSDGLASNKSLHTLTLTVNDYSGTAGVWIQDLGHGLASNKSLHTLTLTIHSYSHSAGVWIEDLGHGLASNKSLRTLTLTVNNYSDTAGVRINGLSDGLASNKSLHTLTLTVNDYSGTAGVWIQDLGHGLASNKSLHTLTLTIHSYSHSAGVWIEDLGHGLASNKSLRTLTLTVNNYSDTAGVRINGLSDGLASNKSLHTLSLTINNYSDTAGVRINGLSDGLASNKSLHTLTLTVNDYRGTAGVWIQDLGHGLASNKSLHTLTLTVNNYIGTAGVRINGLGDGLASNKSLHTLTLTIHSYSHSAGVWIEDLGHGLASNKSLRTLTLTVNNYIGTAGVRINGLGDGLVSNKSLHTLTLTVNDYSGTAGVWIGDLGHGLASNKSLRTLTLTIHSYSHSAGVWIEDLSPGLASNKSVHTLTLTINDFSETGEVRILWLRGSLAGNKSLTTVSLTINNYSNTAGDWMKHLGDGFARNESLTTLSLTINSCSEVSEDQLLELCNNLARSDTLTTLSLTINDHSSTSRGLGCDLSKCFADCKSLTSLSLTVTLYGEENVC